MFPISRTVTSITRWICRGTAESAVNGICAAESAYLGNVPLQGKRVLELGTASGFLCRYGKQGATVVGFDLSSEHSWDLCPLPSSILPREPHKTHIEKLKNGWWFAHRLLELTAIRQHLRILQRSVDISTFGALLLHSRDPFQPFSTLCVDSRDGDRDRSPSRAASPVHRWACPPAAWQAR